MNTFVLSALVIVALAQVCQTANTKHVVYWNTVMTPELRKEEHVQHVKIGDFMDILCPQESLMGMIGRKEPSKFDLYNVTHNEYKQCGLNGRGKFLFACNKPERENKLTLKFQTISPSPLGFRFQYCADYYFIALPRGRHQRHGCNKETTRIHIRVACKEENKPKKITTTTTTATSQFTTTTTKTTEAPRLELDEVQDFIHRMQNHRRGKQNPSTVLVPKIMNPLDVQHQLSANYPHVLKVAQIATTPGNSATTLGAISRSQFFVSILMALVLMRIVVA